MSISWRNCDYTALKNSLSFLVKENLLQRSALHSLWHCDSDSSENSKLIATALHRSLICWDRIHLIKILHIRKSISLPGSCSCLCATSRQPGDFQLLYWRPETFPRWTSQDFQVIKNKIIVSDVLLRKKFQKVSNFSNTHRDQVSILRIWNLEVLFVESVVSLDTFSFLFVIVYKLC